MMLPVFGSIGGRKLMSILRKASIFLLALVSACILHQRMRRKSDPQWNYD